MTPKGYAYFGLYGDFDPGEAASMVSILPCRCAAKHSRDPRRGIPRSSILRYAQTGIEAEVPDIYELSEQVVAILEPHVDGLVLIVETHHAKATLQVVLDFPVSDDVSTPAIGFSKRVVAFVAAAKASIDVDTYRA